MLICNTNRVNLSPTKRGTGLFQFLTKININYLCTNLLLYNFCFISAQLQKREKNQTVLIKDVTFVTLQQASSFSPFLRRIRFKRDWIQNKIGIFFSFLQQCFSFTETHTHTHKYTCVYYYMCTFVPLVIFVTQETGAVLSYIPFIPLRRQWIDP